MILVLNILSVDKAAWLIVRDSQIVLSHYFDLTRGEDDSLRHLEEFLIDNKLIIKDLKSFVLLIKEASLTQVKILTTMANTLAWQFNCPIVADYYFAEDNDQALAKALKKIKVIKKFKAISPKYNRQAEITISNKKAKYIISK